MSKLTPQQKKNWALFAVLLGLVVLMFAITVLRFGGGHAVS